MQITVSRVRVRLVSRTPTRTSIPAAFRRLGANFKVRVEDKDDIKKRLKRSPDKADAVTLLTLASPASGGWVAAEDKPRMAYTDDDEDDEGTINPYRPTRGFMCVR